MYFKTKKIKEKKYKYAVKSARLPDGKVISVEKIYKNEPKKEIENLLEEKERNEFIKYALKKFKSNYIFTKEQIERIEKIKFDYRKILRELNKNNVKDFLDRFTANFTYESNALEGNSLTLKDVAIVMFENATIKNKDLREIYETRNSRVVVEGIIKNKFDVSHEGIIKIHRILVRDLGINEGYKKFPNFIQGREDLKTSLPEDVYKDMTKLIKWYKYTKEKINPVQLAGIFHGRFEQIHPFDDGNGRVGRFLINVILTKEKYPPLIIRKSQRIAYLKALDNFDHKHSDNLERFILERFKETYKNFFEIYVKYL
jgi:Fic family protein